MIPFKLYTAGQSFAINVCTSKVSRKDKERLRFATNTDDTYLRLVEGSEMYEDNISVPNKKFFDVLTRAQASTLFQRQLTIHESDSEYASRSLEGSAHVLLHNLSIGVPNSKRRLTRLWTLSNNGKKNGEGRHACMISIAIDVEQNLSIKPNNTMPTDTSTDQFTRWSEIEEQRKETMLQAKRSSTAACQEPTLFIAADVTEQTIGNKSILVFTGDGIDKSADIEATVCTSVSSKTTLLVCGIQSRLAAGTLSAKEKLAFDMDVPVIDYNDFNTLVGANDPTNNHRRLVSAGSGMCMLADTSHTAPTLTTEKKAPAKKKVSLCDDDSDDDSDIECIGQLKKAPSRSTRNTTNKPKYNYDSDMEEINDSEEEETKVRYHQTSMAQSLNAVVEQSHMRPLPKASTSLSTVKRGRPTAFPAGQGHSIQQWQPRKGKENEAPKAEETKSSEGSFAASLRKMASSKETICSQSQLQKNTWAQPSSSVDQSSTTFTTFQQKSRSMTSALERKRQPPESMASNSSNNLTIGQKSTKSSLATNSSRQPADRKRLSRTTTSATDEYQSLDGNMKHALQKWYNPTYRANNNTDMDINSDDDTDEVSSLTNESVQEDQNANKGSLDVAVVDSIVQGLKQSSPNMQMGDVLLNVAGSLKVDPALVIAINEQYGDIVKSSLQLSSQVDIDEDIQAEIKKGPSYKRDDKPLAVPWVWPVEEEITLEAPAGVPVDTSMGSTVPAVNAAAETVAVRRSKRETLTNVCLKEPGIGGKLRAGYDTFVVKSLVGELTAEGWNYNQVEEALRWSNNDKEKAIARLNQKYPLKSTEEMEVADEDESTQDMASTVENETGIDMGVSNSDPLSLQTAPNESAQAITISFSSVDNTYQYTNAAMSIGASVTVSVEDTMSATGKIRFVSIIIPTL